ncbi:hypothetical protein EJ065_1607 [Corallococcus coralloides]|uniref:Uncharacterized protein n=1 Tax=Corallococcus coralloides TaxID=184914 RepID=A0A410RMZ8_CORCK|nr:hypothetical protein EJ065_1607 [Corallococcus coralloides]
MVNDKHPLRAASGPAQAGRTAEAITWKAVANIRAEWASDDR